VGLFRRTPTGPSDRWLIAGLGNPGDRYARTRHNAGAMALEELVGRVGASLKRHKSGCLIAETDISGERAILARPVSYMNESGRPLRALASYFKIPIERTIVIHDEVDLPFGDVRVKSGGGTAGHNGLASVVAHFGSTDFLRVRIGVSRPRGAKDAADHVLDEFSAAERKDLPEIIQRAADAVERIVEAGVDRAMNEFNTR
jgi:PTH1 family peptidyl-tRNA hydrolase